VLHYPSLPLAPTSAPPSQTVDGETQGSVTPVKSGLETSGASAPLTSLSPADSIPTLSLPVLTLHPPLDQEHLSSLHEAPSSLDSHCLANASEGSPEPYVL
jgi:hypothetical protein